MSDIETWLYVSSVDTFIGAYATDDDALDAALMRNDPDPVVELVTVHAPPRRPGGAQSHEQAPNGHPDTPTPETGPYGHGGA